MGTAEHIRLVTPARSTSAEETSLSREVDHHMLVQLVGFMKEVNVSKSSKVTLAVIISRVLVL